MQLKNLNLDSNQKVFYQGACHDCGKQIEISVEPIDNEKIEIQGGALYAPDNVEDVFVKCNSCYEKNPQLTSYRPIEVYSRVVGYYRPISNWNKGKRQEFDDRKIFKLKQEGET